MLNVQFDGAVLAVRPDGPITREDVATLTRTADEYLADHPKITGVMVETRTFPGFASIGATSGVSHWSSIQLSRRSRSSWPITSWGADAALPVCRGRSGTGVAQSP